MTSSPKKLIVDATYEGGRAGNAGDDPLHKMLGVSNQGGFRYLGNKDFPRLIVLTSNFNDPDWPDYLDRETGRLTYYGDNKKPGRQLHDTPRFGNQLLRNAFNLVHSDTRMRKGVPPFLVFANAGVYRDVVFLGLAVPGAPDLSGAEDLVAVWKISNGQRFQNYRALFTVLDVPAIPIDWLDDLVNGDAFSDNCPENWRLWTESGVVTPMLAEAALEHRTKQQQIPADARSRALIELVHNHFMDWPVGFERCAAQLTRMMDSNFVSHELTRPSRDGGRDAIGEYRIGFESSAILVDFALEAKCYSLNNSVGVREVSRLISRLRHRQFGILVTTSYLNTQAYKEIKEDQHPIVVVSARDIVSILRQSGIHSASALKQWLVKNFPQQ